MIKTKEYFDGLSFINSCDDKEICFYSKPFKTVQFSTHFFSLKTGSKLDEKDFLEIADTIKEHRIRSTRKDICVDYCEWTDCKDCKYENATLEEREQAMIELEKILPKDWYPREGYNYSIGR